MENYLSDAVSFLTHLIPAALISIGHHIVSRVALRIQIIYSAKSLDLIQSIVETIESIASGREKVQQKP